MAYTIVLAMRDVKSMTWYALACTCSFENKLAQAIGTAAYIPMRTVWRKVRKRFAGPRRIKKEFPLIPGYVLVDLKILDKIYNLTRQNSNVYGLISINGQPIAIKDHEIERLKRCEALGSYDETKATLQKLLGVKFEVLEGVLQGRMLTVIGVGEKDLKVDVDGFYKQVKVSIESFERLRHSRVG